MQRKDKNGNSRFMMKMISIKGTWCHRNSKEKRVPFVYSYMTNNLNIYTEAIKQWYENTLKIVPHKKVEGKLFLLFKR